MDIRTVKLTPTNDLNDGLQKAGKESQAMRIETADGQVFIVFPQDGLDRMCEVLQSPTFVDALKEGYAEYQRGDVDLVDDKR